MTKLSKKIFSAFVLKFGLARVPQNPRDEMRKSTTRGLRVLHNDDARHARLYLAFFSVYRYNDATARATSTMAEYLEDQAMEVEALESILMEDMVVVEGSEVRRTHLLRISRKNRTPV